MKDFFLEEAVLDDLAKDLDLLEMPLSEKVFRFLGFATAFIVLIVGARVVFLGVWNGDFYQHRSLVNAGQFVPIQTERGIIYDRYGKPFLKNIPIFQLSIKLPEILKINQSERKEIIEKISGITEIPFQEIEARISAVDLERQNSLVLVRQLTEEQVRQLENLQSKIIQIEKNFKREYFDSKIFSHIIGYTGPASEADIENNTSLSLNDFVGKSGLENYYNEELKGKEGQIIYYRNARGETLDNKFLKDAQAGDNIQTTIDSELQNYFYNRLKKGLDIIGSGSGAGIVLNAKTGEVLSLVSLPSFDNNKITSSVLKDSRNPLFNRIISGVYSPGSTVKPLVALAALREGIVNVKSEVFSAGYMEIPNPYNPDAPSRFLDWKPNGWVNLHSAIAKSSNIYFYAVGGGLPANVEPNVLRSNGSFKGLGIQKLKEYWTKFGFNEKTGIDLPSESFGFLPDPESKERHRNDDWRLGDTYNVSIGQGDLMITPIELVNYIASIANGGKMMQPRIADKIISEKDGVIKEFSPEVSKSFSEFSEQIKEIQKAMEDVVSKSYGSAYMMHDLPIKTAGKTGTAQISGNTKINAFFVGYLPKEALMEVGASVDKQIAVLILVENAREGSLNAVPVAKDVFNWYYNNRLKINN